MFCRSISWLICIFVAVVIASDYSIPDYITGSGDEVTVYSVTTDNPDSSTVEAAVKETTTTDLGALLDSGDGAVVTLVAGDTRLVAHRAVLAARSPVLAAMLRRDTLEASGGHFAVPDVEGPVLRLLVAFLYTLQVPQLPSTATQLLVAADRFGISGLKAECEQQVADQLSVETAAATAVLAVRNSYTSLSKAAIAFIRAHIFQVMSTEGWSNAMHSQPEDLIRVSLLLSGQPADISPAPTADSGTSPATQPRGADAGRSQAPASGAPPTAAPTTPQTGGAAVALLRSLSDEEKGRRLIQAAKRGAVEELQALLGAGADVGARDEERMTALHWAARNGYVDAARALVESWAEVDARNSTQGTPLRLAAYYGHVPVVRLLLAFSADPNAKDENGWTPLHYAADGFRPEAVTVLLQAGADRSARDDRGETPLDIASKYVYGQRLKDLLR